MIPSDPLYAQQWHLTRLGDIETIWDEYSGAGITVGIYDGGVQLDHPDLLANYDPSLGVIIDGEPLDGEPNTTTPVAHGTAVAGLIAAAANNGLGGVGVAWGSTFTSVDLLDPDSPLLDNFANYYSGFHQSVNFDVVNHSWNANLTNAYALYANLYGSDDFAGVNTEYDYVSANGRGGLGTILVQGVANNNIDAQYSGLNASRFTISVAGAGSDGFAADYSNYGACVLVTAPTASTFPVPTGEGLLTTDITGAEGYVSGDYVEFGGTSGAGPIVSGVVALMLDANPNLGWRDVQNIVAASAIHTGSAIGAVTPGTNENSNWFLNHAANWNGGGMHFSNDYGYGLLSAYNAVRMAEVWTLFGAAQTSANEQFWHTENDTDQAIPDDDSLEFDVSLPASPDIEIEHVELRIDLTHSDYTQLRIFLTSPDGTEIQLFDGSGGTDATADALFNWTYGGEALRGENVAGTWTVRIEDTAENETGSLLWYNLVAYGSVTSTDDVYHYTDEFLAMLALENGRGALSDEGGTDWIDAAAVTGNIALNLNPNVFAKVNGVNWFKIENGTTIENAVTGDGNDTLTGNAAANRLHGMRGNDVIDGGLGNDHMFGGKGNDTYVVAQSGDVADETDGNGADTVKASISFNLSDTNHAKGTIENLTLTGSAGINATGNGAANTLAGNGAANVLDGVGGNDTMRGMGGNDTYVVGQTGDVVDETAGNGVDLVKSAISFSLADAAHAKGSVENLTLTGSAAINATGNGLANKLIGNSGANVIDGGAGNDTATGGGGADSFLFASTPNAATNVDHITDFVSGFDKLLLDASFYAKLKAGDLSKKAFFAKKGAEKAKDKQDRIIYDTKSGEIHFDKDGKGKTKAVLVAVLDGAPDLTHSDVLVVA